MIQISQFVSLLDNFYDILIQIRRIYSKNRNKNFMNQ